MITLTRGMIEGGFKTEVLQEKLHEVKPGNYLIVKHNDIRVFLSNIITSPLIKASINKPGSVLNNAITKYLNAKIDLILYKCVDYEVEQHQHTELWGAFKILPHISIHSDLQYVYQIVYLSNVVSLYANSFDEWKKQMLFIELYASSVRDVILFFDVPLLRETLKSVSNASRIEFVDALLSNEIKLQSTYSSNVAFYKNDKINFSKKLLFMNLKNLYTPSENSMTLFKYKLNNEMWFEIWKTEWKNTQDQLWDYIEQGNTGNYIDLLVKSVQKYPDHMPHASESHIYYEYIQAREKSTDSVIPFSSSEDRKTQEFVNLMVNKYGVMKSVILSPLPEVTESIKILKNSEEGGLLQVETFTYWQDYYGDHLIDLCRNWLAYATKGLNKFPYGNIFSGSNEAHNKLLMLLKRDGGTLHILDSEYEGYRYLASEFGVNVIFHMRDTALKTLEKSMKENDQIWISNPNSMNGNILTIYDDLMKITTKKKGKAYVDLVYVGTVARNFNIDLTHECIYAVTWSGSKSFPGLFYYRLGILFTKIDYKEFMASRWFHNMESIRIGVDILSKYTPFDLPRKYEKYQKMAQKEISKVVDFPLKCSDCVWLLNAVKAPDTRKDLDYFYRPNSNIMRFTISEYIVRKATNYTENQYQYLKNYDVTDIIKIGKKRSMRKTHKQTHKSKRTTRRR